MHRFLLFKLFHEMRLVHRNASKPPLHILEEELLGWEIAVFNKSRCLNPGVLTQRIERKPSQCRLNCYVLFFISITKYVR
jgi:hypothetical protein